MNYVRDVIHRLRAGESLKAPFKGSERRIARDLGISRPTVHKYHEPWPEPGRRLARAHGFLAAGSGLPDDAALFSALSLKAPFKGGEPPRPPRVESSVEPYAQVVQQPSSWLRPGLLEQQVEMTAIFQRLSEDHGYRGSLRPGSGQGYSAVRRYIHRLCPAEPKSLKAPFKGAVVRVHVAPGEEAQSLKAPFKGVDFGPVGMLFDPASGRLRAAYVFVATLSYSRHQYAEFVFDQKAPTWIALHRRAFESLKAPFKGSWDGVPKRIVVDNLKAAVVRALVHDPVLGEAYRRMAQHYGFVISPTRPGTPQHKGKVEPEGPLQGENGIRYVQRNLMAGQQFADIRAANARLRTWVHERAGMRQHGTTHRAPLVLFQEHERAALLPLLAEPFTLCEIKPVKAYGPDCHAVIDGSLRPGSGQGFYSVPYRYIGQTLDAHVGERVIQLFHAQEPEGPLQGELVATHPRSPEAGQWQTRLEHYPADKAAYLEPEGPLQGERTPARCRQIAAHVGAATSQVVETLLAERPLDRLRAVQAILRLEESVGPERLEAACARALHFGDIRYRRIKEILNAAADREPLPGVVTTLPARPFAFARSAAEFFAAPQEVPG